MNARDDMNQTGTYVRILLESLVRKERYLTEILELTKNQEALIKQEKFDEDAFEDIIQQKEQLIDNVNEIDKGFSSVYERVRTEVVGNKELYAVQLRDMQDTIKNCVDLGVDIEALEERNRANLSHVFASGYREIRQAKQSKSVANKYYKAMSNGNVNDSILYDRKK